MSEIILEKGKIKIEGKWFSSDDLSKMIQEKMQAGDMKIANLASGLEELNAALKNSHTIETKLVITGNDYDKLKEKGGENDMEYIKKAITAYISINRKRENSKKPSLKSAKQENLEIICIKCKTSINVDVDKQLADIECPKCGTTNKIKTTNSQTPRHQDHFLG